MFKVHQIDALVFLDKFHVYLGIVDAVFHGGSTFEHDVEQVCLSSHNGIEWHVQVHVRDHMVNICSKLDHISHDKLVVSEDGSLNRCLSSTGLVNVCILFFH